MGVCLGTGSVVSEEAMQILRTDTSLSGDELMCEPYSRAGEISEEKYGIDDLVDYSNSNQMLIEFTEET